MKSKTIEKIERIVMDFSEYVAPVRSSVHIAVIVYKNNIVSISGNKKKTHPFQKRFAKNGMKEDCIYLHAEVHAIHKAIKRITPKEFEKSSLYVCRIACNGKFAMSLPCAGCLMCIEEFKIKNVFYTDATGVWCALEKSA